MTTQTFSRLKGHLLFGTSHMLPFIVAGGVLLSIAVMLSGKGAVPDSGILADISTIGIKGLVLFPIILGGYIAYSLADKPALAPAMIASGLMSDIGGGFLGCIVTGFIAGYVVRQLKKIPIPANMKALGGFFLYPLVGTLITSGIVLWGIGEPIKLGMGAMNAGLTSMAGAGKVALGALLGGMTAFDMGGPVNKVATLFAQTQVGTQPWLMGGVAIAICTPPLGMALATFLFPKKFNSDEKEAGKAAVIMGSIGISEGAIPFAANDPLRVLPAIVAGGIVGNVIGFMADVLCHAPWGGLIVLPVVEGRTSYLIGIIAGSLTTALIVGLWKPVVTEDDETVKDSTTAPSAAIPAGNSGHPDIVAVSCCPSGVAHTFMAAAALEKAAKAAGINIKVETQGQDGIQNRITADDIKHAKKVILAHDIQVKEPERFASLETVECSTKDAIKNAAGLFA
ncbi:fructose-specific phosphotransferase system enzyme IIBC component [Vibrio halioticoli NBRC 102217]|uniref:protein-N(pi)-phosphohistidine--D-fructose phosphotransferase n=1 Tax=Vibrio halioticoli NBRC 102217 TaxID=1219072 RepID=V5F1H4_9VIBR|nr:fructose-specific PTS transporter subunit EIIC [Vibrio halioticoli]GAD88959.1 fructose-specific phosphotransferase system enzyme IIBC component [Vibrio halioticoli NBRC 102217]